MGNFFNNKSIILKLEPYVRSKVSFQHFTKNLPIILLLFQYLMYVSSDECDEVV